jgi:hypothetical protein
MSTTLQILRQLDRTLSVISWYGRPTTESRIEEAVKGLVTPLHVGEIRFGGKYAPPVHGYLYRYMSNDSIDDVNTYHMINAATNAIKYIVESGRSVDQKTCPKGSDFSFIKPMSFMPLMYTEVDTIFTRVMRAIQGAPPTSNDTRHTGEKKKDGYHTLPGYRQRNESQDQDWNHIDPRGESQDRDWNNIDQRGESLQNMLNAEFRTLGNMHINNIHINRIDPSWLKTKD